MKNVRNAVHDHARYEVYKTLNVVSDLVCNRLFFDVSEPLDDVVDEAVRRTVWECLKKTAETRTR